MIKRLLPFAFILLVMSPSIVFAQGADELDRYVERLKMDKKGPLKETGFLTAGSDFLYGQEYFEAKNYFSAVGYFRDAVRKQEDNAFANYQLAISLIKQKDADKAKEAQEYLNTAFRLNADLKERYTRDVLPTDHIVITPTTKKTDIPSNKTKNEEAIITINTNFDNALVYGEYKCSQSIWNGPNKSPAYSFKDKGYFTLRANGTYKWLDNGETGKYKYDAKKGTIEWLSGYLASAAPKSTQYKINKETTQMTINFTDSYRWECSCKK